MPDIERVYDYSIVVPVYRNEATLAALVERLIALDAKLPGELELVFVIDGSPDASVLVLRKLLSTATFGSQLISLSRNFGSWAAIRIGLSAARGRNIAVMAADMQEPPELVEEFFEELETGQYDVAVGVRTGRNDPLLSSFASRVFWATYRRFVNRKFRAVASTSSHAQRRSETACSSCASRIRA